MMTMLYEVLKTAKMGAGKAPDLYTALLATNLRRDGEVKTLSGIPPLTFTSNGQPLLDYLISGNTVQSGTPSPQNPVMPLGCGERTGNLCTGYTTPNSQFNIYIENLRTIVDTVQNFTLSFDSEITYAGNTLYLITDGGNIVIGYVAGKGHVVKSFSFNSTQVEAIKSSNNPYIRLYVNGADMSGNTNIMLNLGSTALPYGPYGYKIPISSAGQTNNIYLGEVETTRKIKKFEVEIERVITLGNGNKGGVAKAFSGGNARSGLGLCDRALYGDSSVVGDFYINRDNSVFVGSPTDTLDDFKSKYDGASLWYVLATPETTVTNEPLMKIGDYADTVSMAQAGVEIPTVRGTNTLDVLTDVKPSEVYIKYKE